MKVYIREKSWQAALAAKVQRCHSIAMVINNTIYLHNTSAANFIKNKSWLNHELTHVQQYKRLGTLHFIVQYLWECLQKGYYNNSLEAEARSCENDNTVAVDVELVITSTPPVPHRS